MVNEITIPCSPEQEDVIADHLLYGGELGILPDERAWIRNHLHRVNPHAKVIGAELDIENAKWIVQIV